MCLPEDATVKEKFVHSVKWNAWYGPLLVYTSIVMTVTLIATVLDLKV